MGCCSWKPGPQGKSRLGWFTRAANAASAASMWVEVTYHGQEPLSLTGPVTGARYHFGWRGATLPVDRRDATNLLLREDLRTSGQ